MDMGDSLAGSKRRRDSRLPIARLTNALLLVASLAVSCVIIELGFRALTDIPILKWEDWRHRHIAFNRLGGHADVDPTFGWSLKPNFSSPGHNTLQHGIRRNGTETEIRTGHVLAVGDSFTEGWEVEDRESWPAHLEAMTGTPIVNAGTGGYGTDQILMRAEQMLPIVKPHTLIIGFIDFDLDRTEHVTFGAPKPWFTAENGHLQFHPPAALEPPPEPTLMHRTLMGLRGQLAYSAVADFILARLAPSYWYGTRKHEYVKSDLIDAVDVTCLLFERLKPIVERQKIRTVLFMQYYAPTILENDAPPDEPQQVMACAEKLGFEVVDQFASLKALTKQDPEALRRYYLNEGEVYRHMTNEGKRHAARILEKTLRRKTAAPRVLAPTPASLEAQKP